MHPGEAHRLRPGASVWIWVVRLARGRWWPGTVRDLQTIDGQLRITVKFECRPANGRDKAPVIVGSATTAMRYLELREVGVDGIDQPRHRPISLLERPEESEVSNGEDQYIGEH